MQTMVPRTRPHLVAKTKLIFRQFHTTAQTFGDTESLFVQLSGEFKRHSTESRVALLMNPQAEGEFFDDIPELPSFESRRGCDSAEKLVKS